MSKIDIFLLDNINNIKEKMNIIKPKTYENFIKQIKNKLNQLNRIQNNYELFFLDKENKEIKIENEDVYNKIDNAIFIRMKNSINKSLKEINYNLLSTSKEKILGEKNNCNLCSFIINKEKPYLCYKCQKIITDKFLNNSEKNFRLQNEVSKKNLNFNEDKKDNDDLVKNLCEYKLNDKINNSMNKIKDEKKEEELIFRMKKQKILIKKYEKYIEKSMEIFKNILNKINSIHSLLRLKNNNYLNDLLNINPLNFDILFNNISKIIYEELDEFQNYLINNNKIEKIIKNRSKSSINNNDLDKETNKRNVKISINQKKVQLNQYHKGDYKNKINLIYFAKFKGNYNIFGEIFVLNNKNDVDLIINGKAHKLVNNYELKRGENNITLVIKNKLINLCHMFSGCGTLKDIKELKYLDITNTKDFSSMFWGCLSLSDITPLEDWNVSNIINFSNMFGGCSLLTDIASLKNWDVSNGINFESMFWGCSLLEDITPLQNWNVSNGYNFSFMFSECLSLSEITALQNWNISSDSDISYMIWRCPLLSDKALPENKIDFKNKL